ncbi:MAG: tetratricopeptide repeat protein [Betaproteobacteria bacterium]
MNQKVVFDQQDGIGAIIACFSAGRLAEAERLARQRVEAEGNDETAIHLLAQCLYLQEKFSEAIDFMRRLLEISPTHAGYYNDCGVMQAALGHWSEAEALHRMSLVVDPSGMDAHFNLALMLFRQDKRTEALAELEVLEKMRPDFADLHALRAEILLAEEAPEEAVKSVLKAVELGLNSAEVLVNLSTALSQAGCGTEVEKLLRIALQIAPADSAAHYYLGNLLRAQGKTAEAESHYRQAIAIRPDFAEAHNNLGLTLQDQGDVVSAEEEFKCALNVAPKIGAVYNNLGNCYLKQGKIESARVNFLKAVEYSPELHEAWNNLGELYYRTQRLEEAESAYRQALVLKPDSVEAGLNLGILLLLWGRFEEGWVWYEKRWEMPATRQNRPRFKQPEWAGEPLAGKTLLIYVEQGMGDNLQFVRYLRVLRERYPTARIYYWCLKPLFRLFSSYAASCGVELLPETVPGGVPPIDYHIALLTVPERLGTRLESIPAEVPYLTPSADLVKAWAVKLAGLNGKKVGLVWASGEAYLFHKFRTMQLEQLKPLLEIEGISWVSLQKGDAKSQIAAQGLTDKIVDLMDGAEDFADTAAIIANLDLVISVDTSVPHLAGAMGVPVWLLDRFDTDWRWLLDRTDCPWYPTMRIFRQTSFADWSSVVPRVVDALSAWAEDRPEAEVLSGPLTPQPVTQNAGEIMSLPALKLNLGCGRRQVAGFVNVDCVDVCQPDMVVNLEQTPWPWAADSVDEIKLSHVLEHLGQSTDVFLSIIREMYRVCRDGARIEIVVPHPRSDHYLGDPTHVRPITLPMLTLFDQRLNRKWEAIGAANTPLGIILEVDFEVESAEHSLEPEWQEKLSSGQMTEAEMASAVRQFNNVVEQSTIIWRVRKGRH